MEFFKDKKIKKLIKVIKEDIKGTCFEGKVYLVGGLIRDSLLNLPLDNVDVDIVVSLPNGGTAFSSFMCTKNNCFVNGVNPVLFPTYGTAKFQLYKNEELKDIKIECVQTRKEQYHKDSRNPSTAYGTIEEDAKRRDLTINSLYYNISEEKLYDFNNSIYDLTNCIIRTPSDADIVFSDDPLRQLRVIRFATKLGWGIEKDTWLGMIKNAHRIDVVSQERITDEISKILLCDKPSEGIRKMYNCGILHRVMKDIYDMNFAYESRNPMITTFEHTMKVLDTVQPYIEDRLAALFHDVGRIVAEGRRDISQEKFSADVAVCDLKAMKYSNNIVNSVETAILNHRFFEKYGEGTVPTDKSIRKFINKVGNSIGATIDLMNADNIHRAHGKKIGQVLEILDRMEELEKADDAAKVKLPINGNDIMTEFKLKPSPLIGILLDEVKDKYFENPNITREEALQIVENELKKKEQSEK